MGLGANAVRRLVESGVGCIMKHKPLPKWPWDWAKFYRWRNTQCPRIIEQPGRVSKEFTAKLNYFIQRRHVSGDIPSIQ